MNQINFPFVPEKDQKMLLIAVVSSLFFGVLAHGYAYSNPTFSHDSIFEMGVNTEAYDGVERKISTGRFLQPVMYYLRGNITVPWFLGLLSLIFLGLASFLLTKTFRLPSPVLTSGILSTCLGITLTTATYAHEIDMFGLGCLFAVAAVAVFELHPKGHVIAPLFIACACGFYQTFLSMSIVLMELLILRHIFQWRSVEAVILKSVKAVCSIVAGILIYYFASRFALWVTGIENTEFYNAVPSLNEFFSGLFQGEQGGLLAKMYSNYFSNFKDPASYDYKLLARIHAFLLLMTVISMVLLCLLKKIHPVNLVFAVIIFVLVPFSSNTSHFLTGITHNLMEFAFVCTYFFPLFLVVLLPDDISLCRLLKTITKGALWIVVWMSLVHANQFHLKKQIAYDNTLQIMNRVIIEMENTEGYIAGETPVLWVGTFALSEQRYVPEMFRQVWGLGSYSHMTSLTYAETYQSYFYNILAYPINLLLERDLEIALDVTDLPSFPEKGYCQFVDGILVVRLSDKLYWTSP